MSEKLLLPTIDMRYAIVIKTKNEPICVQIRKYRDACIDLLLGLTK